MDVVIVESPAKAKTINKYLGGNFRVLASYGHVRDLPAKDGSVKPDDNFSMSWEVAADSKKRVDAIADALKGAEHLYLATDPDREGEAISWHVQEVLEQRNALNNITVKRVVFHEITKTAVLDAIAHPRDVNQDLVEAYLARRALDYLVGFTLSPVLWRKLPGSRSAGRVQSVALRLICERESEIEIFKPKEYWSITGSFKTSSGDKFDARLTHFKGKRLKRLDITNKKSADEAKLAIEQRKFQIGEIERKTVRRNPAPPFTTSTLQQEASRKLGFSASRTMQTAQKLYEGINIDGENVGLITYMRTDSVTLSNDAISASRKLIKEDYGPSYLPDSPRIYKTKAKNAQEAHEAIRPTDFLRRPLQLAQLLDGPQLSLYELIWNRTVACEMESAAFDQVAADLACSDRMVTLRANGSILRFDGFLKLYKEGEDDRSGEDDSDRRLPSMEKGQAVQQQNVVSTQHFTQPPPRYTEASLVKKMEELGIGRPSTYASILKVLQDRNYVILDKRRFEPEDRGRVVTAFLANFFRRYVDYDFTADLEEQLDNISGGTLDWKKVLEDFWVAFSVAVDGTKELRISDVLDRLDEDLGPHFFGEGAEGELARKCPACEDGRVNLKIGRYGAFIGCNNYPDCRYTKQLAVAGSDSETADGDAAVAAGPKLLGIDPTTNLNVTLRKGPYGFYVQLGDELEKEKGKKAPPKPKRASVPRHMDPAALDLDAALGLLSLPREVGPHPETGRMITAGIGRFGPYIKHGSIYISLKEDDVLSIGLNRAVTLFAEAPSSGAREVGDHPRDGKPITIRKGRWGLYVKHGRVNASLPDTTEPDDLTIEQAVILLDDRAKKGPQKKATTKKKPKKKKQKSTKKPSSKAGARLVKDTVGQ
ncbi:MAG: type I DNA topoisomerase [Pseudomonadota bacterium]|nr:type I DNA topoisomerase [Pseudomonadota bacterium]